VTTNFSIEVCSLAPNLAPKMIKENRQFGTPLGIGGFFGGPLETRTPDPLIKSRRR
jgi:hypothetical protein